MKSMATVGRILFALPFAIFGINHFVMMDYYMGMLTSFIPKTGWVMVLTGIIMIATSISIITRKLIRLSTIILAGLLFVFILTIHIPHLVHGFDKTTTLITLLKDISLLGSSLFIAGIYSDESPDNIKK